MSATPESAREFVVACQPLKGDEKGEAQTFLNRFFRVFGYEDAIAAGATFEERVEKGSKKDRTGFADLVWKPRVLFEMKKRGFNLSQSYAQAQKYWLRLVPNRPRYVVLCNFDEFWIFDFEQQIDTPMDVVLLSEIPDRLSAFRFMETLQQNPIFRNNQVEVTGRTARRLGELYQTTIERGKRQQFRDFDATQVQRFILQCVLAMFAEDRGLLPRDLFVSLVRECMNGESTYDAIGGLFREMNRKGITPAGRYKGVEYFNGGLFATIHPIELTDKELEILDACATDDWSNVRPSIFGNIFEGAIDPEKRHARGIHYTSEGDIYKIVRPTIIDYWEDRIEAANTIGELNRLQLELQSYKVLDPACGSGNFLYVAYQELKRIEKVLLDKIASRKRSQSEQLQIGLVTPLQFFGIDTNSFAVELARVTLTIARKIAIDKLGLDEPALPLDTLDKNIVCQDALLCDWPQANAIVGNPPFLGGKHLRIILGDEYIDRVFSQFPDVKDSVDFCSYWFRKAHDNIDENGRAGLVATNSIAQGKSRAASLDYIVQNGGYIYDAVSTQPWSGESNVHVSLVNWCRQEPHQYVLDKKTVTAINSSLQPHIDVSQASRLEANLDFCFQGVIPLGKGFLVDAVQVRQWLEEDDKYQEILKLFSMGSNLAKNPNGQSKRWVIDFYDLSLEEASEYGKLFEHIKENVKPERDKNRREVRRVNWWKFGENAPKMRNAIAPLSQYFAVPEVSKWAIFVPCPSEWLPGNKTKAVVSEDFYIFGILTSNVHRTWMNAQKSTLEDRTAYTHKTCFETFPFPQTPTPKQVEQIRKTAIDLHEYRSDIMEKRQWGITKLYNEFFHEPASQLYKLHAKLDNLAMQAYGFAEVDNILEKLLQLNQELAEKEQHGEAVVGPWDPTSRRSE